MIRRLFASGVSVSPAIFSELVGLLFTTAVPMAVVGTATAAIGMLIAYQTGNMSIGVLSAIAMLVTIGRVAVNLAYRRQQPPPGDAHRWERYYGVGSFSFAVVLGMFGARTFQLNDPVAHMLATGLLFGYAAGMVNRVSVRPLICIGSVALATVPFIIVTIGRGELAYLGHGAFLAVMLLASMETVRHTYRTTVARIATKRKFEQLARVDALTGLPNRLLLEESLQDAILAAVAEHRLVAVHFLDLDRFKAANDQFGHPVGDALLVEVSRRLRSVLRQSDLVARIGGDEFVVAQCGAALPSEAEMLARRMIRTISAPYAISGHEISIGVSVGVAIAPHDGNDPQQLITAADAALYQAKRSGRGAVVFTGPSASAVPAGHAPSTRQTIS